jgi:ABC-type transporter Mla MlaB component
MHTHTHTHAHTRTRTHTGTLDTLAVRSKLKMRRGWKAAEEMREDCQTVDSCSSRGISHLVQVVRRRQYTSQG